MMLARLTLNAEGPGRLMLMTLALNAAGNAEGPGG